MTKTLVSIILPTRNRSQFLAKRLRLLETNTPEIATGEAEVIIAYDDDDVGTSQLLDNGFHGFKRHVFKALEIPHIKWNQAARHTSSRWLVVMSDDSLVQPNWLTNALNMITRGFIGLPDGVTGERNNQFTPLYMATREWLKQFNGGCLVIPVYKSWYSDIETAQRAKRSGTWMVGKDSIVKQLHADYGTAEHDEIYKLGESRRKADLDLFMKRMEKGWPDDFERIL